MYVGKDQKDWDVFIPSVLFGYRTSPAVATQESPFYLMYGREPRLAPDASLLPPRNLTKSIEEHRARIVRNIEIAHEVARANIQLAQQKMKAIHDRKSKPPEYQEGHKVWVFTPVTPKGLSKKLRFMWNGPFRIVSSLGPSHFILRTCDDNRRVAAIIHANRLKPFRDPNNRPVDIPTDLDDFDEPCLCEDEYPEDSFEPVPDNLPDDNHANNNSDDTVANEVQQSQQIQSESVNNDTAEQTLAEQSEPIQLHDSKPIFRAEKLIGKRKRKSRWQYLVKWEGCPESEASWEPTRNIFDKGLIENYNDSNSK